MGGHGGRPGAQRVGARIGARIAVTVGAVLTAVALLAGVSWADDPTGGPVDDATGAVLGAAGDPGAPPCAPPVRACVDLNGGRAWLLDGGAVVRGPVAIVPGAPEDPTPRGRFTVQWKAQAYTSREFLVQMPWAVFFADGGIAFHQGNPETYSRGCVKLSEDDARAFFGFLQVGDPVQVV